MSLIYGRTIKIAIILIPSLISPLLSEMLYAPLFGLDFDISFHVICYHLFDNFLSSNKLSDSIYFCKHNVTIIMSAYAGSWWAWHGC